MSAKAKSSEDNNTASSDSLTTTRNTTTIYIPNHIYHSLIARKNVENLELTTIFNTLIDLFINSKRSFLEFKNIVTDTFKVSYNSSSMSDKEDDEKRKTLTLSLNKDNYNALKKYVEDNKNKEYGISFSSICVILASLLTLSNTHLHVFVKKINEVLDNK